MNEYRRLSTEHRPPIGAETADAGTELTDTDLTNVRRFARIRMGASGFARAGTRRSGSSRLMALACVACLVVLQCFVVLPAVNGQAHAADDVTIAAEYTDGTYAQRGVSKSWLEGISDTESATIINAEGEEEEVSGPRIEAILKEAGIKKNVDTVVVGGYEVSWKKNNLFLVVDDGTYRLVDGKDLVTEGAADIYVKRSSGAKAVSFSKSPTANKSNPSVGDTIKITYKLSIDSFFKGSDDYKDNKEAITTLTWEGNSKVKLLNDTTSGTSGTVKAKVKKSGTITITPNSDEFPEMTDGVKVSVTGQTKTTTRRTTATTRHTYTPYRPTSRSGATISRPTGNSGASTMTTAPRPEDPTSTVTPSFQTITVKEVFMTPVTETPQQDTVFYDDNGNPIGDDNSADDQSEEKDWDTDGVTFPAAAGSAAVAAAACGAGAVNRVRRFRNDMGGAAGAAAARAAAADGGDKGKKEKKEKNPLAKFRKK